MNTRGGWGNRANASAEIEFVDAIAHRLGDEGAGISTILEMVHHTRLDTAMAPAGLMRAALDHAHHWVQHRSAFDKQLNDQPLMRSVLADLTLDWEGTLALGLYVARAFDGRSEGSFGDQIVTDRSIVTISRRMLKPYRISEKSPYLSEDQRELSKLDFKGRSAWMAEWLLLANASHCDRPTSRSWE